MPKDYQSRRRSRDRSRSPSPRGMMGKKSGGWRKASPRRRSPPDRGHHGMRGGHEGSFSKKSAHHFKDRSRSPRSEWKGHRSGSPHRGSKPRKRSLSPRGRPRSPHEPLRGRPVYKDKPRKKDPGRSLGSPGDSASFYKNKRKHEEYQGKGQGHSWSSYSPSRSPKKVKPEESLPGSSYHRRTPSPETWRDRSREQLAPQDMPPDMDRGRQQSPESHGMMSAFHDEYRQPSPQSWRDNAGLDRHDQVVIESVHMHQSKVRQGQDYSRHDMSQKYQGFHGDRLPLTERFGSSKVQSFIPKDNIQVGIERNISGNDPPVIEGPLRSENVVIIRGVEEGEFPLCKREEFLERPDRPDPVEETRVIRVVPEEMPSTSRFADVYERDRWELPEREEHLITIHREKGRATSRLGPEVLEVDREPQRHRRVLDRKRSPLTIHPDLRAPLDASRGSPDNISPERGKFKVQRDPGPDDLRHNITRKRTVSEEHFDARHHLSEKRRHASSSRDKSRDSSRKLERKEKLPDFSKRPDKYVPEDKPYYIPKSSEYFEHDNRDRPGFVRGRGRGFVRGRGRGRGYIPGFRGRGNFRGRPFISRGRGFPRGRGRDYKSEPRWKHDKFKETEEEDSKPSSTTK